MFGTIHDPASGYNPFAGADAGMPMETGYLRLAKDQAYEARSETCETAALLLQGSALFAWEDGRAAAERPDPFDDPPACLHAPKDTGLCVTALGDAELLVIRTENREGFPVRFYRPDDTATERAGETGMGGCARRDIRTVFDYSGAPYSNLVVGEVVNHPGRWSSWPPHRHPQPELYFYRFDRPQGFGACFMGDEVYKVRHLSWAAIPGGADHPQAAAPGYAMHYVWVIRHLPGNPWNATRIGAPEHGWMLAGGADIWKPKEGRAGA
jgi:5-deoxy-glucuronate isomerase